MEPPTETLLAANTLVHTHGNGAEEFATTQLWQARQGKDETGVAKWLGMLEALKRVREIRGKAGYE